MTSFGVEWDTAALINLALPPKPGHEDNHLQKLPPGSLEKVPFIHGDKWTLTLEKTNMNKKRRTSNVYKEIDCLYTLESQLGVFNSRDPSKFNTDAFKEVCVNFNQFWVNMIKRQGFTRKGRFYPVLAHYPIKKEDKSKKYFVDCRRTFPGLVKGEDNLMWAYTDLLASVGGKPQVTIGIELKRVLSIFKFIVVYFNRCMQEDTTGKPCRSMEKAWFIIGIIKKSYYNTVAQLNVMGYTKFGRIVDDNIIAFIVLTNYYFVTMVDRMRLILDGAGSTYNKAYYMIKLRSNLRVIFDTFTEEQQEFYTLWATNYFTSWEFNGLKIKKTMADSELEKIKKDTINGDIENKLVYWFYKFFINVDTAYMISPNGNTPVMVNTLGLYSITPDQMDTISNHVDIKKVKIYRADWTEPPPHIIYEDGVIKYQDSNEILGFDYMEWGVQESNIFIEIRAIHLIYTLHRRVSKKLYEEDISLFNSVNSNDLCQYIVSFMKIMGLIISLKTSFPQISQKNYFLNPTEIRGLLTSDEIEILRKEGIRLQSLRQ